MDGSRAGVGEAPKRVEDERFLTGAGVYVDDMVLDGMAHAVVLRSPHAHARILNIGTEGARAAPGVLAVLTGSDQAGAGIRPIAPYRSRSPLTDRPFAYPPRLPLAVDRVRHVGEPVAVVVGETRERARDAGERIAVAYESLPAAATPAAALAAAAGPPNGGSGGNLCAEESVGDRAAVDAAFEAAAHVARVDAVNHRVVASPMEPRGAVGVFDAESKRYTLHVSCQGLHLVRDNVAATLGVEPGRVRFMAPDVGGGFGAKNFPCPEYALTLWAARETGRPVKWIDTRGDTFAGGDHARDHVSRGELALDAEGRFLALRVSASANLGAYLTGAMGAVGGAQYVALTGTVYALPAFHVHLRAVHTNTAPVGVTRGPGFAEAVYLMERAIDRAARDMDVAPAELRRRNLVRRSAMPFTNAHGTTVDSGDFPANQEAAAAGLDVAGFDSRRKRSEARGRLRGYGIVHHIKITMGPPEENVELRFDGDDRISLVTGTTAIGQGHETTFRQLVSGMLGVPNARVRYLAGDTDLIAKGGGHGSSRATFMAGTAMHFAAGKIVAKGRTIAARFLEAAEADVEFADGRFRVAGTDRAVDLFAVARLARDPANLPAGMEPGLDACHSFAREHGTFPNGCHAAEVEVDPDTGAATLLRYVAVDDFGVIVNPTIAAGQVHGAVAQGVGQALLEHAVYDPDTGQLLTGSFMDYALPRADDLPSFDLAFQGVPCATNPLGVKGLGEAGAVAAFPAVVNAVLRALAPLGVTRLDGPATPQRVWRAIREAGGRGRRSGAAPSPSGLDGRIGAAAPLGPGPVVHRGVFVAEQMQPQREHAGADARAARGDDGPVQVDPAVLEGGPELAGLEDFARLGIGQLGVGEADAARDVAAPQARPGLRLRGVEPPPRPGVQHLRGPGPQVVPHPVQRAHQLRPEAGAEGAAHRGGLSGLDGPVLPPPFRESAREHRRVVVAEQPEHPPRPAGRHHAPRVVGDDAEAVSQAEGPGPGGEVPGARDHVGQVARRGVADLVDVEADGARNVRPAVVGVGVAVLRGQIPGGVDDRHLRIVQVLGQPFRGDEGLGPGVVHGVRPRRQAKESETRRFRFPLLWILSTRTRPISPVRRTWVPPQGCRSWPSMRTRRTRPDPRGGLTAIVLTRSGRASSASSEIHSEPTGWSPSMRRLSSAAIRSLSRAASGTSKSSRPFPSPTWPPVTG